MLFFGSGEGAKRVNEELAFRLGARGWCVSQLQEKLNIRADGRFGPQTYEAVAAVEKSLGREAHGTADSAVFAACNLPWPDEFERALALVAELEGTSFDDCNAADIDGPGLTMGICGFTTRHGEVQALVETFLREVPEGWQALPASFQNAIKALIERSAPPGAWEKVLLNASRCPRREIRTAITAWGQHPLMRQLQISWARTRFWEPACRAAELLGVSCSSGRAFLLDVWVQNGGWRECNDRRLHRLCPSGPNMSINERLRAMALAVAGEAKECWRADVLSRKLLFARGAGMVHGTFYSLLAQAVTTL